MKKILIFGVVSIVLCACSSSKELVNSLSKHSHRLGYKHDSKITECERKVKIAIGAVRADSFDIFTRVSKTRRSLYPFIVINSFVENFWVRLGQNSLQQRFPDFFLDSFLEESERTGCYTIVDDPKEADYVIDFILKDHTTEAKYRMTSNSLFLISYYATSYQESGSPATTRMEIQIRLTGRSGRSEKTYTLEREMPQKRPGWPDSGHPRYDFMANMAESLSMTAKECIEMIINDINLNVKYRTEE
ncbi:MAG: hypothetical protein LBG77_07905 [Dysgonamonadaceae bacterium]|jgi:hypothetical protein|nr:hypothetical protein [Dysgonamonadaceae bacterium]